MASLPFNLTKETEIDSRPMVSSATDRWVSAVMTVALILSSDQLVDLQWNAKWCASLQSSAVYCHNDFQPPTRQSTVHLH